MSRAELEALFKPDPEMEQAVAATFEVMDRVSKEIGVQPPPRPGCKCRTYFHHSPKCPVCGMKTVRAIFKGKVG